eukprot:CAMPEP_0184662766 /NCGR_PEP_ID=MMETSP0308-20130426/44802_1 /TAXON_ID=38269 /ORGANISM="Gloeochaete witrockiana, Strain SAG 46.84" /LENGTH=148 /DNA_ID=CAMNT_0027105001 /DNA_START=1 /DNA_END=444 /DNA_ORIENTATION=+
MRGDLVPLPKSKLKEVRIATKVAARMRTREVANGIRRALYKSEKESGKLKQKKEKYKSVYGDLIAITKARRQRENLEKQKITPLKSGSHQKKLQTKPKAETRQSLANSKVRVALNDLESMLLQTGVEMTGATIMGHYLRVDVIESATD